MVSRFEQKVPRKRRAGIETLMAATLFLVLLLQVGLRIHMAGLGYEVAAVQNDLLDYDAELRQLRADYASLHRAERLKEVAQRHGLQSIGEGQIRYVGSRGKSL